MYTFKTAINFTVVTLVGYKFEELTGAARERAIADTKKEEHYATDEEAIAHNEWADWALYKEDGECHFLRYQCLHNVCSRITYGAKDAHVEFEGEKPVSKLFTYDF